MDDGATQRVPRPLRERRWTMDRAPSSVVAQVLVYLRLAHKGSLPTEQDPSQNGDAGRPCHGRIGAPSTIFGQRLEKV